MSDTTPIIYWVRKDLRLTDNRCLAELAATGRPVIPVFILDEVFEAYGACPRWRFGLGAATFAQALTELGSRLVFRRGKALNVLEDLIEDTGATGVHWSRAYDPAQIKRDTAVMDALKKSGIEVKSHPGHLLFEPWRVETQSGDYYKVYSPFWKSVRDRDVGPALSAPNSLCAPASWPAGDDPEDWGLGAAMDRGADIVRPYLKVGEDSARARLSTFIRNRIDDYPDARNMVGDDGTSRLSEHLAWGEISPRSCWHAGLRKVEEGSKGAETFLKELVWREFAYHLAWHTPHMLTRNWHEGWDEFPWRTRDDTADVKAWKSGRTGEPFVDAAMRELYTTGHMHNRARMVVASYLSKHLLVDWRIGQRWFEDCLADWDPASNAMGWQWTAGTGPDAAPYFRVFNPQTQLEKFDPDKAYRTRWIAELSNRPGEDAMAYFQAVPRSWDMDSGDPYPEPVVDLKEGRERALAAYQAMNS